MPHSYKIHKYPNVSVAKMLEEKSRGIPVTLTSHPGNASLYKLSLWSCGVPETLWDITCVKADKNNQPAHMLKGGEKTLLIEEKLFQEINQTTTADKRYVTAYQQTRDGQRLGRVHVKAMEKHFWGGGEEGTNRLLSSQSRQLLSQRENVQVVLEYLAEKDPMTHFPRHINSAGIMRPYRHVTGPSAGKIVDSCMGALVELEHLLFSDKEIVTQGGIVYGFPLVPVIATLCDYWKSGETTRYDVSGPDMIHYSMTSEYQASLSRLLDDLHKNFPSFVPKKFEVYMANGVLFRTGNCTTDLVASGNRFDVLCTQILNQQLIRRGRAEGERMSDEDYEHIKQEARNLHQFKPFVINPAVDSYYSQHDGVPVVVPEMFATMPLSEIEERSQKLKSILRI